MQIRRNLNIITKFIAASSLTFFGFIEPFLTQNITVPSNETEKRKMFSDRKGDKLF